MCVAGSTHLTGAPVCVAHSSPDALERLVAELRAERDVLQEVVRLAADVVALEDDDAVRDYPIVSARRRLRIALAALEARS